MRREIVGRSLGGLLAVSILSSCIEGEEEIWIHSDGSGRARVRLEAPAVLFNRFGGLETLTNELKTAAEGSDNIELEEIDYTTTGPSRTLTAEVSVKNLREVTTFLKSFRDPDTPDQPSDVEIIVGALDYQIGFPNYSFSRDIDLAPLLANQQIPFGAERLLGESQITYTLHLPTKADAQNATEVSRDSKTLRWTVPLARMLKEPTSMSYTAQVPIPGFVFVIIPLPFLLFLAFLFFRVSKRRTTAARS